MPTDKYMGKYLMLPNSNVSKLTEQKKFIGERWRDKEGKAREVYSFSKWTRTCSFKDPSCGKVHLSVYAEECRFDMEL